MRTKLQTNKINSLAYGAKELKEEIGKNTILSFASAILAILILFSFWISFFSNKIVIPITYQIPTTILVGSFKLPDSKPSSQLSQSSTHGTKEFNGESHIKTVLVMKIPIEDPNFNNDIGKIDNTLNDGSNFGNDINDFPPKASPKGTLVSTTTKNIDNPKNEVWDGKSVEVPPSFDINELQRNIEYPVMAIKIGAEGTVRVKVLIAKDGNLLDSKIEKSDNFILEKAALDAVRKYKNFQPAFQNSNAVNCWITIPIVFKLRN